MPSAATVHEGSKCCKHYMLHCYYSFNCFLNLIKELLVCNCFLLDFYPLIDPHIHMARTVHLWGRAYTSGFVKNQFNNKMKVS